MCSCGIERSNVDEESFAACNDYLSEYVAFQARLSGTATNSSEYLISHLEEWVSTGPSIIVSGLRMEVANDELTCMTLVCEEDCLTNIDPPVDDKEILGIVLGPTVTFLILIVTVVPLITGKCRK